jgi:hypothetical protein
LLATHLAAIPSTPSLWGTTNPHPHRPIIFHAGSPGVAGDEEISPEEERALAAFMPPPEAQGAAAGGQKSLSGLIVARIREQQQRQGISVLPE